MDMKIADGSGVVYRPVHGLWAPHRSCPFLQHDRVHHLKAGEPTHVLQSTLSFPTIVTLLTAGLKSSRGALTGTLIRAVRSHLSAIRWSDAMANSQSARFGALLLQHRAAAGLTQEQLAARESVQARMFAEIHKRDEHTITLKQTTLASN